MLPRSKRLTTALFTEVMTQGKILHSPFFTIRLMKTATTSLKETRFSVVVSKKIVKTAVERNKIRRRVYSIVRASIGKISPGFHIVLLAKQPLLKAKIQDIATDLSTLFVKSGLIK